VIVAIPRRADLLELLTKLLEIFHPCDVASVAAYKSETPRESTFHVSIALTRCMECVEILVHLVNVHLMFE
jgi:hypothetical protein